MRGRVDPDDLLVLREVGRTGRYTRAAEVLGLNHTTIARRIAAVERALGGRVLIKSTSGWELTPLGARAAEAADQVANALRTLEAGPDDEPPIEDVVRISTPDAFAIEVAAPAAARVRRDHPGVSVEIISATRRAGAHRSGLDIEVVVGEPHVLRAEATPLAGYVLGMYGSRDYLAEHGTPTSLNDIDAHGLVYFIPSMLQVDHLDVGRRLVPDMHDAVTSTNVIAHITATRAGAGIGLLPTFLAARHDDLVRVLPDEIEMSLHYWLVTRPEATRRPAVTALLDHLAATLTEMTDPEGRLT